MEWREADGYDAAAQQPIPVAVPLAAGVANRGPQNGAF